MKKTAIYPVLFLIIVTLIFAFSGLYGQDTGENSTDSQKRVSKYTGNDKRDPFLSLLVLSAEDRTKVIPPPPLEERPPGLPGLLISEVSVSGVATGKSKNIIVLKGIDGINYIAEPGSKLYDGVLKEVDNVGVSFIRTEKSTDGKMKNYKVTKPFHSSEKQVLP